MTHGARGESLSPPRGAARPARLAAHALHAAAVALHDDKRRGPHPGRRGGPIGSRLPPAPGLWNRPRPDAGAPWAAPSALEERMTPALRRTFLGPLLGAALALTTSAARADRFEYLTDAPPPGWTAREAQDGKLYLRNGT